MHQKEKIQVVFESVELEKQELQQERSALRKERSLLEKERVQLSEDRILMQQAAKKMSELNLEGAADVSEVARKIKIIKSNTDKVVQESQNAISSVKQQKRFSGVVTVLMTVVMAFAVGLASAHYSYTNHLEKEVLASRINAIESRESEIRSTQEIVVKLKNRGFQVFKNAIVLPDNWEDLLGQTKEGEAALFIE